MHGEKNYPFQKEQSDLDIELPDGTGDDEYLEHLERALYQINQRFTPNLILYVAGLDVHQADRLGKLSLSDQGVLLRDQLVLQWAHKRQLPVAAVMAGGYFPDLDHLTDLQLGVIKRLADYGKYHQETIKTTLNW
jgi:acetoin utilization deacetylase AcuC-like enzyme